MTNMKIGNIELDAFAALAPMAGVADISFRTLCRGFGAAYTVGEMVSAKGIQMKDKKSDELLLLDDAERPSGIQLFGDDPFVMAQAAVHALQYHPEFIDINMGCPAPKVTKGGAGSSLMKNPALAGEIVKAVVQSVPVPVSVKIRAGWDKEHINAVQMAEIAEKNGAFAVTVHGRTRDQMYSPPVNLDIIRDVKKAVSVPVIGNGDITDARSAAQMYEETGCDFIMVGRGALGRPWLFSQINAYLTDSTILPDPPVTERMMILLRHAQDICNRNGEKHGICEVRKHALWYTKGLHGAARYRRELSTLQSLEELQQYAFLIAKENT
ncbi:MAG: tRNA dihydrouridine synthase DusB [Ruminococcaceae bacterium]|nr:tRNA dihydrouridine synthase DusB [Oscillospiraceae bacterium]